MKRVVVGNEKTVEYIKSIQNCSVKRQLNSAIVCAVKEGNIKQVKHLLQEGADIDATDQNKNSLLVLAVERQNTTLVNLLLSKKANINLKNEKGNSAWDLVCEVDQTNLYKIFELLKAAHIALADRYYKDGNIKCSLEHYLLVANKPKLIDAPTLAGIYRNIIYLYLNKDDLEKAKVYFKKLENILSRFDFSVEDNIIYCAELCQLLLFNESLWEKDAAEKKFLLYLKYCLSCQKIKKLN